MGDRFLDEIFDDAEFQEVGLVRAESQPQYAVHLCYAAGYLFKRNTKYGTHSILWT